MKKKCMEKGKRRSPPPQLRQKFDWGQKHNLWKITKMMLILKTTSWTSELATTSTHTGFLSKETCLIVTGDTHDIIYLTSPPRLLILNRRLLQPPITKTKSAQIEEARKLKQGALYLYVGNGVRAQVEAIGSYDLVLPNGLVICLDNYFGISVSKNNVFYFNAIPSNGIYEIDMHDLVPNVNSIYNVSTKRAKHNLDSTYLWHCRLAHISKKRIEKLQQEGLLKSTDDESFDQCVSCLSGKMTRKSFPHHPERATDLLGIIHTDVCGPLRHVSRQGASYFITFTDDYSRYGYVYLLKHKHEVFETFKVFKNEVENQLGKIVKALQSDRGGEYISQEFKDYLKACGIVQQLTPPYTPQHNGVSERRNRTLLDMVRSMMNLTTLPLSFWDYALESATCILNMVPTKKVDKTPYELWYGKVPNLSYLKVWGCEALVKRDTPDKLQQRSVKCIFIGYPKETMGYYFYFPPENKIVVARYAEFFEKNLITQEVSGRAMDLEEIQDEDTSPSECGNTIHDGQYGFVDPNHPKKVCKLQRFIYGLKQASRSWNKSFDEEIKRFGFAQNLDEPCVYQKASGSNVIFLILYVDDIIIMGNHILSLQSVKDYLGKCFAMKDLRETTFILGIKIYRDMSKQLIGLERLDLNKTQGASTPKEVKRMQNVPYALAVGSIMYADTFHFERKRSRLEKLQVKYYCKPAIAASEAEMKAVWIRKFISGLGCGTALRRKRKFSTRSPSLRPRPRKEGGVFNGLGRKEPATSARSDSRQRSSKAKRTEVEARRRQQKGTPSRTTSQYSESEDSEGGHWKSKSRRHRSSTYEDDLTQPWTCEERNPFTSRIQHFSLPRTRMPSHVKTYDGSGDPEDHLKLFQSAAKTEGWAMPTWCHMFNSTLTGNARVWFDKLPKESIDSYEDLRTTFRENYLQQTKHIKVSWKITSINAKDEESTETSWKDT
ncbi:retrotransposon protein, putative, ty1-copia subclass [Tanacetum coccineum]